MTQAWWKSLHAICRPGSPTVLCEPEDEFLAIDLARRGFRLFVLHQGSFDIPGLRQTLRTQGLSSQLMGSQTYQAGAPTHLVKAFYELWIYCGAPRLGPDPEMFGALKAGSLVIWSSGQAPPALRGAIQTASPEGISALRIP